MLSLNKRKKQQTINIAEHKNSELVVKGRHDPCIVIRAAAVMDAMTAIGILDLWKERALSGSISESSVVKGY